MLNIYINSKNIMKKILLYSFIAAAIFISCQKDFLLDPIVNTPLPTDSCRIQTSYFYGGGGVDDSANYIYEAGRLVRVEGESARVLYGYSGNRLVSMHFYEWPDNVLYRIDSFHYLNDSMISRLVSHDYDMYNHNDTVHAVVDFTYNGTKLMEMNTIYGYEGYSETDTSISEFRWTGDNVSSILLKSNVWADDSIYYQYDTNPNYFQNVSKNFLFADPFFQLHVGLDPHLPYFISKNNVTQFTIYTDVDYPILYEVDSLNRPILVSQSTFPYMGYKYECP
jgi:hypothetical protein